jgi:hypothetical protein
MPVQLSEAFLALRPEDHVLFGVQWWGAEAAGDGRIRVGADGGLLVTFPPQHVGEGAFAPGLALFLSSGALGGPSQVAVSLPAGTVVTLDAAGVIAALAGGRVLGRRFADGSGPATAIELPYGLVWSPAAAGGGAVACAHPLAPAGGPTGAAGLWRTRLRATTAAAGLAFAEPEVVLRDPEPSAMLLDALARQTIVDATQREGAARVDRLELGALGGSLGVARSWQGVDWSQAVALGRDQQVRLVLRGVLYPFGHHATYIEAADRRFDPADSTAALRIERTLVVTEPTRPVATAEASLARMFPFDDVEVAALELSGLGPPAVRTFVRPAPDTTELQGQIDGKRAQIREIEPTIADEVDRAWTPDELGTPEANDYVNRRAALDRNEETLGELRKQAEAVDRAQDEIDALNREIDRLQDTPVGPDGLLDPSVQQAIDDDLQKIREINDSVAGFATKPQADAFELQLQPERRALAALLASLQPQLDPPHSLEALSGHGVQGATDILQLQADIASLEQRITDLQALATSREWMLGPTLPPAPPQGPTTPPEELRPLLVPVRCSRRDGGPDLHLDVPVVFVHEFQLDPIDGLGIPAFDSLRDGDLTGSLQDVASQFFAEHAARAEDGEVVESGPDGTFRRATIEALPDDTFVHAAPVGLRTTLLDVVHGQAPAPGDHLEVHGFSLAGVPRGGAFVPAITSYQVALPAVRGLVEREVNTIRYRSEFLRNGDAEKAAVAFADAVGIDFRRQADRAGALLAPVIDATGISRLDGPVSLAGLVADPAGHLDPAKLLGEGASILGFDLRTLIGQVTTPPRIVQQVLDGSPPRVEVTWQGIALDTPPDGPFDAEPRRGVKATCSLSVVATPDGVTTDCSVHDFALCFPSRDDGLLRLTFGAVRFQQQPGRGPDLSLKGVGVEFLGDLHLLEDLAKSVDIGGNVPRVAVAADDVSVGYAFAVPEASCGEFTLRNIAVRAGLDVPFQPTDDRPVSLSLGFASRAKPFNLSVMALGGGGYVDVQLDRRGLRRMELSLEFGATIALNLGIVAAEVHALGGVRTEVGPGTHVALTGYIRIGGSVELLGLVTVTIELVVSLRYDETDEAMIGRATVVVDVDLTLYSHSFTLDSGEWRLLGGGGPAIGAAFEAAQPESLEAGLDRWRRYRAAFATEVATP